MAADQVAVCNQALAFAGTRSQLTSVPGNTTEGIYCNLLYAEFRDYLLRQGDYDFAMMIVGTTGSAVAPYPWAFTYNLPSDCVRIRQLITTSPVSHDPQPMHWNIASNLIYATTAAQTLIYTSNLTPEAEWDTTFTDAFVRFLGSGLFFALENRIEAHKVAIQEALEFAQQGTVINP